MGGNLTHGHDLIDWYLSVYWRLALPRESARRERRKALDEIRIRALSEAEIPSLAEWLAADPLWQRYGLDATLLAIRLRQAHAREDILLVSDAPGAPSCGLAWILPEGGLGRGGYLRILGLRSGQRGQGIGTALLVAGEHALRQRGQELMLLLVADFNARAEEFYRRAGYRCAGALPEFAIPGVSERLFYRRLLPIGL